MSGVPQTHYKRKEGGTYRYQQGSTWGVSDAVQVVCLHTAVRCYVSESALHAADRLRLHFLSIAVRRPTVYASSGL
jgi:hypothetical protein